MPVIVPNGLPAIHTLASENITVMTESRAKSQDIRPMKIVILNLMPTKIATENQLIRLLSNTPLQVEITFLQTKSHEAKNVKPEHLKTFYRTFDEVKETCFDGLIITGAPVETLAFEKVDYWEELCQIMKWSKTHIFSTFHLCWGAQAGLYFHHGIKKYATGEKLSGIYTHNIHIQNHPFLRGFDDQFQAPHSRYTEIYEEEIEKREILEVLATSKEAGVYMVASKDFRQVYVTGHPEYELHTLTLEYVRDVEKGIAPAIPVNYFPDDNPRSLPEVRWRAHGSLLFSNWLNVVYQEVPYELEKIKELV